MALTAQPAGLRHGNLVAARIRPRLDARVQRLSRIALLFDTSASRALGFAGEVERLGRLLEQLRKLHGDELHLQLATFDQSVTPVFVGPIEKLSRPVLDAVLARRPLGASDLHAALGWLTRGGELDRAIIVTDGIATAGPAKAAALRKVLRRARGKVARLDVVLRGGIRADRAMGRLVVGALEQDGVTLDGAGSAAELARRISQVTRSGVTVKVAGAKWCWPNRLDGIQPGDETLVFAHLKKGALEPTKPLVIELGGSLDDHWSVPLVKASGPLLQRAAAGATIARLADRHAKLGSEKAGERHQLQERIVALSTRYRVLSDFTALLVLETEQDYRRYGIDRRALSDVLTVGPGGVEPLRPAPPLQIAAQGTEPARADGDDDDDDDKRLRARTGLQMQNNRLKSEPVRTRARLMPRTRRLLTEPLSGARTRDVARTHRRDERRARNPGSGGRRARAIRGPSGRARAAARSSDEGYGYEFSDDPFAAGGFGPNDATIRVRPGPAPAEASFAAQPGEVGALVVQALGKIPPYTGPMATVMGLVETGESEQAVVQALAWRNDEPGDIMALIALGEALEARGNLGLAARAYGSIVDLYPARADMGRFAANRLERLDQHGSRLAIDAYRKAVADRPDHLSGHRLLAYAWLRAGKHEQAFAAIEQAFRHQHRSRVRGAKRVLREDLGLIAAAWLAHAPHKRAAISERLAARSAKLATEPSLRFVLTWETDANDVDLHVFDGRAGHAYYASPELGSGGRLYHDVTNGYGPECFAIHGPASGFPYRLAVHYYSRGPMGYGMGKVEIVEHDGRGNLRFDQRPFVVMNDQAFVDLGVVTGEPPGVAEVD